jgi:ankyrin repeat protein
MAVFVLGSFSLYTAPLRGILGEHECARILIDADADLNIKNEEGKTPIQWAKFHGQTDVIKLLERVQASRGSNQGAK